MTSMVHLGDVAEILKGQVPAKVSDDGDGPRLFGIAEISGHAPRVLEPGTSLERAVYLRTGDVVVALLGERGLGATALIDGRADGTVLARECAAMRVSTPSLLSTWLYAWTKSEYFNRADPETRIRRLNVQSQHPRPGRLQTAATSAVPSTTPRSSDRPTRCRTTIDNRFDPQSRRPQRGGNQSSRRQGSTVEAVPADWFGYRHDRLIRRASRPARQRLGLPRWAGPAFIKLVRTPALFRIGVAPLPGHAAARTRQAAPR